LTIQIKLLFAEHTAEFGSPPAGNDNEKEKTIPKIRNPSNDMTSQMSHSTEKETHLGTGKCAFVLNEAIREHAEKMCWPERTM
jgi:hypothetical protein